MKNINILMKVELFFWLTGIYYRFFSFYKEIRWYFSLLAATFIGAKFLGQFYQDLIFAPCHLSGN